MAYRTDAFNGAVPGGLGGFLGYQEIPGDRTLVGAGSATSRSWSSR